MAIPVISSNENIISLFQHNNIGMVGKPYLSILFKIKHDKMMRMCIISPRYANHFPTSSFLCQPRHIFESSFIKIVKYQWVLSDTFTLNFFSSC